MNEDEACWGTHKNRAKRKAGLVIGAEDEVIAQGFDIRVGT